MTDHSERDEAADKWEAENTNHNAAYIIEAFKAGADWAVKNDPRVLKLVEALRKIGRQVDMINAREKTNIEEVIREWAADALTEWSKP